FAMSPAGSEVEPWRPRNSARSPVQDTPANEPGATNATRDEKVGLRGLRARSAPSSDISVMIWDPCDRDCPNTHSTYAAAERRRGRLERLLSRRRKIFTDSSIGTDAIRALVISAAVCSNRLYPRPWRAR